MPHGQWLAFDGPESVHDCSQFSEYGPEPSSSTNPAGSRGRNAPSVPTSTSHNPQPAAAATNRTPQTSSPPKKQEFPAWVWWLIGIVVLYFIFKK